MKRTCLAIVMAAVVILAAGYVSAETGQDAANNGEGQKHKGIMQALNLSPEQQQKLEENRKAQRETATRLRTAIRENQDKLQQALKSPDVTRAAVEPLVNEIKSIQDQLIDARVNGIFAVKSILTAEQFAKFQEMTQKMQEKMKEKGKKRFKEWRDKKKGAAEQSQ